MRRMRFSRWIGQSGVIAIIAAQFGTERMPSWRVISPALISGTGRDAACRRATELLRRVGLSERLEHKPGELSGGEQQRVAVARAIIQEPRVVLADEPTGNLDPSTAAGVQDLLIELNVERRLTLVIVTHSATLAGAMDRTLRLAAGRIAVEGTRAVAVH